MIHQLFNLTSVNSKHKHSRAIYFNGQKMSSEYSDIHRGFLQVVMSRGTISKTSANEVLADLFASGKYR